SWLPNSQRVRPKLEAKPNNSHLKTGLLNGEQLSGSANLHDTVFHCALEPFEEQTIVLADKGFKAKVGTPSCLKICDRGAWNERMLVETLFSLFTTVLHLKKLAHRKWSALRARLAYTVAPYNLCTAWSGEVKLQLATFAL
ncbi:hypothetical protein B1R32_12826, partial [Abditibacterium utsteinense]